MAEWDPSLDPQGRCPQLPSRYLLTAAMRRVGYAHVPVQWKEGLQGRGRPELQIGPHLLLGQHTMTSVKFDLFGRVCPPVAPTSTNLLVCTWPCPPSLSLLLVLGWRVRRQQPGVRDGLDSCHLPLPTRAIPHTGPAPLNVTSTSRHSDSPLPLEGTLTSSHTCRCRSATKGDRCRELQL